MNIQYQDMINLFSKFIWPLPRISGLFLTMPLVSSTMVPARIRIIFAMALSFICAPFIAESLSFLHFNAGYVLFLVQEILLGVLMGFILQIVFQIFIMAGQVIAMQTGLGFAIMVDPASKVSVPLLSQFYLMLISLLFLNLNGHLAILEALLSSFQNLPIGKISLDASSLGKIIMFSGWMFKEAVLVALPAILALLIVNLAFAVMARVAPQLNLFSMGFPITLLMGMFIIYISLPGISAEAGKSLEQGMQLIVGLLH
ncbi:flagellar biosynthetic protein FliR [Legionella jordanis]|uniref:Flagellar biosynthetic protein FliR n=1 Tax=Legionella jordanis TaxID=456 RepID=A0A0W0V8P4_9GAMM|nr:flagellar biosynthetic protein FliR [Legionella jordanis]KTD16503.1 flagellar biosynthetic protein fliR [Legionella jordanis]RMX03951.1 flagellar biosynthetic protein FliR [Legionella jordanis]RMX21980.1 flagellar biosynthetic protein FliR [Legionella jordanis]VEH12036.1 flagellar biosynthetic protein FliR [Legionella jordanis]HAT8712662.1 flagellar biosynthetic protein FliR [Legionella jordanis]